MLLACELGKGGGEGKFFASLQGGELLLQDAENSRSDDVQAEEAEVMPRTQTRDDELLLGQGGRGLFEDILHFIETIAAGDELAADGTVVGQFAFLGGLHTGDGAFLLRGDGDDLFGAAHIRAADPEVIANEMEEGLVADEFARAVDGMTVATWVALFDELDFAGVFTGGGGVGRGVTGGDDDGDVLTTSADGLVQEDVQGGAGFAIAVHKGLEGESALVPTGGGDDCFPDVTHK